jgi:hypothetical protein
MQVRGPVPIGTGPLTFAGVTRGVTTDGVRRARRSRSEGSAASQESLLVPVRLDDRGFSWSREGISGWITQRSHTVGDCPLTSVAGQPRTLVSRRRLGRESASLLVRPGADENRVPFPRGTSATSVVGAAPHAIGRVVLRSVDSVIATVAAGRSPSPLSVVAVARRVS